MAADAGWQLAPEDAMDFVEIRATECPCWGSIAADGSDPGVGCHPGDDAAGFVEVWPAECPSWEAAAVAEDAGAGRHREPAAAEEDGDAGRQRDEAEAMAAMYGADFVQLSPTEWLFRFDMGQGVAGEMRLALPEDYPSRSAPALALDAPVGRDLKEIHRSLLEEFEPGSEVAFAWAERFREICRDAAGKLQRVNVKKKVEGGATPAEECRPYEPKVCWLAALREANARYAALPCARLPPPDVGPSRGEIVAENQRIQEARWRRGQDQRALKERRERRWGPRAA
mmetsp:Transcript_95546/g.270504  ORF Transcript_95546/g.270504 Transcript_95546/m.270504 type:complete len:284 (+) Transcript_95546:60-911(+)